jgi:hypothetical protein
MQEFDDDVWKIVLELGQEERHFNQIQHQYRLLTSSWLLAMFAGIGFALSEQNLCIPSELAVSIIGFAGGIGITMLWNLDVRVYHQLLESCFVQGLKLEEKYPWLPSIRSSMLSSQKGTSAHAKQKNQKPFPPRPQGVLARVVWFYLVANTIALLIAMVGIAAHLHNLQISIFVKIPPSLIVVVGILLIAFWNYKIYKQTKSPLLEDWVKGIDSDM